jgi:Glycoside hydrolase family 44
VRKIFLGVLLLLTACATPSSTQEEGLEALATTYVYTNTLTAGWQNWSWGTTVNLAASSGLSSSKSISATITTAWAALWLQNATPVTTTTANAVQFYINGGASGGQQLTLKAADKAGNFIEPGFPVTASANTWTLVRIPLGDLGVSDAVSGLVWQDATGTGVNEFKLDSISFVQLTTPVGPAPPAPKTNQVNVYFDTYESGFYSWSWGTRLNPISYAQLHTGKASLAVTHLSAWAGAYLHSDVTVDTSKINRLHFWLRAGTQKINLALVDSAGVTLPTVALSPKANIWTEVDLPLSQLGSPDGVSGIVWQDGSGGAQATFYLDEVSFYQSGPVQPVLPLKLEVNPTLGRYAISEDIYGISWASETLAKDLRLPLRRSGGNAVSRYNWKVNNTNRGSDYFFLNAVDPSENVDTFIAQNRRTATQTLLTVPMMGWVTKDAAPNCGFSVKKYGPQQATEPFNPDCGNGIKADGTFITGNDPKDTSIAVNATFAGDWIKSLVAKYGRANAGGVRYYAFDNEPALWNSTHRDVHPAPLSYDELLQRTIDYGAAIKAADPSAKTLGPVEWGWPNYFYSAKDIATGGSNWIETRPDRRAHGDKELVAWYLGELSKYQQRTGTRLLDYLDLHFYPQGTNVSLTDVVDPGTKALRLRSTRALWDPTYKDESWINDTIKLIPRMRDWVNQNYPGTKLAITEYNWGALGDINGAVAQADVLGILGRERVDLALLWGMPDGNVPGTYANVPQLRWSGWTLWTNQCECDKPRPKQGRRVRSPTQ